MIFRSYEAFLVHCVTQPGRDRRLARFKQLMRISPSIAFIMTYSIFTISIVSFSPAMEAIVETAMSTSRHCAHPRVTISCCFFYLNFYFFHWLHVAVLS